MSDSSFILQFAARKGLVSKAQLQAVGTAAERGGDDGLYEELVRRGFLERRAVLDAIAEEFALRHVDLSSMRLPQKPAELLDEALARQYRVFPIEVVDQTLVVAFSNPLAMDSIDSLSHLLKMPVEPVLADGVQIEKALGELYDPRRSGEVRFSVDAPSEEESLQVEESADGREALPGESEAPIIRLVQMIITEAIQRRASDIHLEPLESRFRVRFRVDGELQEMTNPPPKRLQLPVVSRIKVMGNLSIAEKRLPQDGRIQARVEGVDYDLRVSSLPTAYGESIVLRILDKSGLMKGLPELGLLSDDEAVFEQLIAMPDGMLLVTGPTGSGKTTTLYSCLNYVNKPDRKIITVEDPIEYQMAGINQVPVRKSVGMTFAAALKAILRQAPNIIMVGEIRDLETAEIAINASLTGHMVFSTLHTNDAPSAVTRLIDIGVKPYLVATSLRTAVAQRLVRRICPDCAKPREPSRRELAAIGIGGASIGEVRIMEGRGCSRCHQQGMRGRFGIFEMLQVNDEIERLIYSGGSATQLRSIAKESGMRTMREDGIRKVLAGMTSVEEVLRVTVEEPVLA